MRQHILALSVVVGLTVAPIYSAGAFNKAEYAARRSRVMEKIGDGAAIVLGITGRAHEVSAGLPRTVAQIEALMKTDGILQLLNKNGRAPAPR